MIKPKNIFFLFSFFFVLSSCQKDFPIERSDGAKLLEINIDGSIQNPAFSPDGKSIVFTRFHDKYNKGAASLYIYNLETGVLKTLVSEGGTNVSLPGSVWNDSIKAIVFSSERNDNHDEIFMINENGTTGSEIQLTNRSNKQAFEPSFSPNGDWIVFESHNIDEEGSGVITKYKVDGSSTYVELTSDSKNSKQPNWSPKGDKILFQQEEDKQWEIWTMDIDGGNKTKITSGGENTDAVFSQDGNWIIYSSGGDDIKYANIFKIPVTGGTATQITNYKAYDGAPSISPNGLRIAFESYPGNPERSKGTKIYLLNL